MDMMNENSELEVLFHAFNLENGFSSTKISRLFKCYKDDRENISREVLLNLIGVPSDHAWELAREEVFQARDIGIQVVSFLSQEYPAQLLEISDPPLVLFISAKKDFRSINWQKSRMWGVVGARNPSRYGLKVAEDIGANFSANGITVISGLAYGIDKASHEGALKGSQRNELDNCPTIAVLGSGLLEIYPSEHRTFAKEIIDSGGAILTEYGLRMKPRTFLFPRRNRIISGLSFGIVVVEARKKSGSLITARLAMEQGREVYCVPGPIDSSLSEGVNLLIKDGAGIISSVEELIEKFAPQRIGQKKKIDSFVEIVPSAKVTKTQERVLQELRENDLSFEELLQINGFDDLTLRRDLLHLEIKGFIVSERGLYCIRGS